jgi:hypothetical protein
MMPHHAESGLLRTAAWVPAGAQHGVLLPECSIVQTKSSKFWFEN